jgi:hypothetical protein
MPLTTDFVDCFAVPGESSIIDGIDPTTGRSFINGENLEQIRERYPLAVVMPFDDYMAAKAERQNTPIHWVTTTNEQYDDMLGVLPPIAWSHDGFLVGEPDDHSVTTGRPRYRAYRNQNGAFFVSTRPLTVAEFKEALRTPATA